MLFDRRIGEHLHRRAKGHDFASLEHHDGIRVSCHSLHVMVDHDDGDAVRIELFDDVENLLAAHRVELRGALVKHQNARFHDESGSESHTLHLSTRQFQRVLV